MSEESMVFPRLRHRWVPCYISDADAVRVPPLIRRGQTGLRAAAPWPTECYCGWNVLSTVLWNIQVIKRPIFCKQLMIVFSIVVGLLHEICSTPRKMFWAIFSRVFQCFIEITCNIQIEINFAEVNCLEIIISAL